jgi:hypothetical protein
MKKADPNAQRIFEQNEFLIKAYTTRGFIDLYLDQLRRPEVKTRLDAFENVNEKFRRIVGERRYKNYDTFRVVLSRTISKKQ